MPSAFAHPAFPLSLGLGLGRKTIATPLLVAGLALSLLPDADVIGLAMGVPYAAPWGHRGASHSLALAALVALAGALLLRRWRIPLARAWGFLFLAMASHGLLDTLTTGGLGVALGWPFSDQRWFAPVRMVRVSPFAVSRFLSARGVAILLSELLWIWLPCIVLGLSLVLIRRNAGHPTRQ